MKYDDELLPCPFCGCRIRKLRTRPSKAWAAQCDYCDAGPSFEGSRDEVVAVWNRRAPDARDARISQLEAARFGYASEFPPNADGDPDVGSIHANIRKLKAELAALKAPAPIPSNPGELEPATPWYPDDSGEWVEVPEDMVMRLSPPGLRGDEMVTVLSRGERQRKDWKEDTEFAPVWDWDRPAGDPSRIVAYKVVKP